mgnify:CR=1 FL=1
MNVETLMRTALVGLLFLYLSPAHAEVYKCTNSEGQTSYQSHPCEKSGSILRLSTRADDPMTGCYEVTLPGWETGKHNEKFEIKSLGNDKFDIFDVKRNDPKKIFTMKRATAEELSMLSEGLGIKFMSGLSNDWGREATDTKPVGMYKVKDKEGNETYFAYLFLANGPAKKVACK